jgi:RNA polymerase sigma factor (sigma-70 family)
MDETQLLAEFREHRSEEAFNALVRRHVDFVYATALRQIGDCGLAEEITQDVFVLLARKARSLGRYKTIAGWLYQTTLHRVRQRLRSELRRRRRDGMAAELKAESVAGKSVWEPLVPLLDEGLEVMEESDRVAVLLHCLEGRPFREVGETLGVGEDAARKRVNRALDQLTEFFRQHGFAVPSITAGVALFVSGAAPASLVGSAVSAGMAAVATAATLGMLTTSTTMKVGLATVLVAAVATPMLFQQATIRKQEAELGLLRNAAAELDQVRIENARLAVAQVDSNELARLREGYRELMRLRAEVALLRTELAAKASADAETSTPAEAEEVQTVAAEGPTLFRAQFQVTLPLGSTILTGGWATGVGRRSLVVLTPNLWGEAGPDGQVLVTSHFVEAPEQALLEMERPGWSHG